MGGDHDIRKWETFPIRLANIAWHAANGGRLVGGGQVLTLVYAASGLRLTTSRTSVPRASATSQSLARLAAAYPVPS